MGATISDLKEKIKSLARRVLLNGELFPAILLVVVGVLSFGLGRLSVGSVVVSPQKCVPFTQQSHQGAQASASQSGKNAEETKGTAGTSTPQTPAGKKVYVGSKNGTKYHLPWCSGAARIAEANKVWFASKEVAAVAGYTPASNCKGI